ncbi:uncharacterized protein LOC112589822 [Harpegnathos saltator]|uniref:uncharacterized protein LOC112589822 n=1 Tax=Harpegnathos saltator TaxID=610380 RepID=UPI000DBEEC98|nr:uncharacterized protein LOC112589822 [Harpegnathos saltator]
MTVPTTDTDTGTSSMSNALKDINNHSTQFKEQQLRVGKMNRNVLDGMTLKQLQEEAVKFRLPVSNDRERMIEQMMSHLERHGPMRDLLEPEESSRMGKDRQAAVTSAEEQRMEQQTEGSSQNMIGQVTDSLAKMQRLMQEQQQQFMLQQQNQFERLLLVLSNRRPEAGLPTEHQGGGRSTQNSTPSGSDGVVTGQNPIEMQQSQISVSTLASQIPEFGGTEEENAKIWIQRVDCVAAIHGATDGVTLLAATARLTGAARKWYDAQYGPMLQTWRRVREELLKIFDREIAFYKIINKIENRKWNAAKETFDQYALDKLVLMQRTELSIQNKIQLLISGIAVSALRATALSLSAETIEDFLTKMRRIAEGVIETERKAPIGSNIARSREIKCRNCNRKGHPHKECRSEPTCFYCKEKGHRQFECPVLKRREGAVIPVRTPAYAGGRRAAGDDAPRQPVAVVQEQEVAPEQEQELRVSEPFISVATIMGKRCQIKALIDTGSPVSFINEKLYKKPRSEKVERVCLFEQLPLCIEEGIDKTVNDRLDDIKIDYNRQTKEMLLNLLLSMNNKEIEAIEDGHAIRVPLKDKSIYAYAPRRFAFAERDEIKKIIDNLLARDIIKPSISPYCARIVPVKKRNGSMRLYVDLRPLNSRVEKQKYTFPLIEDCLAKLANKSIFTLLDIKDGFHHIKIDERDTKYFAFGTPDGQYEYKRLPFGYSEAPAEDFKRDNIAEHLEVIGEVLIILKQYKFELNYDKCLFLRKEIEFLGYIVRANGITLNQRHVEAITKFREPRSTHQVQQFLGLTGYFRRFIKDFALKARPLQDLLKKGAVFDFSPHCREAFNILRTELTSFPTLRLYDPAAETEIHTDACIQGLGAILLQRRKDGVWAPIAFYSKTTNQAEAKYHSFELEMLAVVRAVERFHVYVYGKSFTVVTDCNALVYAVNKANLNPRIARWTLALQNYNFKLTHRSGKKMAHVDALSRNAGYVDEMPLERELEFRQLADPQLQAICRRLEFEDDPKFALVDGLLYRK